MKRIFQTFDELNVADGNNQTKHLQISNYVVEAKTAKGGGHVVMGVPAEIIHLLFHKPETICLLLVVDRKEYEQISKAESASHTKEREIAFGKWVAENGFSYDALNLWLDEKDSEYDDNSIYDLWQQSQNKPQS